MSYAQPDVLVETKWVQENLNSSSIRIAEVDYDAEASYKLGHVPGAVLFDWRKDMNDPITRDILSRSQLEGLLSRSGVSSDTTLLLYGDFNNWFAAFAFWILKYYGVEKVKLINGGRKKWIDEDRPLSKDAPSYSATSFKAPGVNDSIRVFHDYVRSSLGRSDRVLVDVRSPKEFTGEVTAPPEYPNEHAQRGGHIPGAKNIPWGQAVKEDGTFKSADELKALYVPKGVTSEKQVITYCRIGERSSHTWFVLKYLLGYLDVRNYDGSWTEWGNTVRNPIEKP